MCFYKILYGELKKNEEPIVGYIEKNYEKKYGIKDYDFYEGKLIESWDDNLTFYYDSKKGNKKDDYLVTNMAWLIFSERFKQLVESLNLENVQFLPIKVLEKKTNKELDKYYILNITNLVDAVDLDCSDYSILKATVDGEVKKIYSIREFALKKSIIKDLDFVRVKKSRFATFFSEGVKKIIEDNNLTGFGFSEVKVV